MTPSSPLLFTGPVHLVDKQNLVEKSLSKLEGHALLGFDTETKPSFKKGDMHKVCLLQLANDDEAFLFRLHLLKDLRDIFQFLLSTEITKVGLAVHDDIKGLQKLHPFEAKNFIDLQHMAKEQGHQKLGLKSLVESVLGRHLSKKDKLTNWEAGTLSPKQMQYASTDAWVSLQLYRSLKKM